MNNRIAARKSSLWAHRFLRGFIARLVASCLLLVSANSGARCQATQQFAELGDLKLENGQIIKNCRIGYRTYGVLNADKGNAILFPSWFGGKAADLDGYIGQGVLLDTAGLYIVTVDALGNGVSSSPSNSKDQPGAKFPAFSIRDMVESQFRLLTEILKIQHLRSVLGISMGGMQAFQWLVSHPTFLDKAIPIVGTPKLTSQDLLLWKSQLRTIQDHRGDPDQVARGMKAVARIHALHLFTPAYHVSRTKPENVDALLDSQEKDSATKNADDWSAQLIAMINHDIYKTFGGTEEQTEKAIRAKALVIAVESDHMVNPAPAIRFAERNKSKLLKLTNDSGHLGLSPDMDKIITAVREFIYTPQ